VPVTHDVQQAARLSDGIAVFPTGGELVEFDDTRAIVANSASQRVGEYITGTFG
jgi:ABC-type phosphate transport system ATPase subunit